MPNHTAIDRRGSALNFLGIAFVLLSAGLVGCAGGFGGFTLGVGSTPSKPPGTSLRVLGRVGTPFSATVSDATSTWFVQGSIPLSVVLVNATLPVRMVATKQSPGSETMSLQLTVGFGVKTVASTSAPFGTASIQSAPTAPGFAPPPPPANPDIRFFVKGPRTERFSGLIEDTEKGFVINDRAPTLYLFENPVGKVDAIFTQIQNLGPFDVDLIVNGAVVLTAVGGPTLSIKQP